MYLQRISEALLPFRITMHFKNQNFSIGKHFPPFPPQGLGGERSCKEVKMNASEKWSENVERVSVYFCPSRAHLLCVITRELPICNEHLFGRSARSDVEQPRES